MRRQKLALCVFHCSAHTCECVSTELSIAPVVVFQNLMQRSAVPPPRRALLWNGHHASAFTAAWCASKRCTCVPLPIELWSQM